MSKYDWMIKTIASDPKNLPVSEEMFLSHKLIFIHSIMSERFHKRVYKCLNCNVEFTLYKFKKGYVPKGYKTFNIYADYSLDCLYKGTYEQNKTKTCQQAIDEAVMQKAMR